MKTKSIITIAAIALLPVAAFTQPNPPNPPPPPPGSPPTGPVGPGAERDRHEKKVPVTFLGVETSEVPNVVSEQLGLAKGFGLVVDYVVPDGPAAAAMPGRKRNGLMFDEAKGLEARRDIGYGRPRSELTVLGVRGRRASPRGTPG